MVFFYFITMGVFGISLLACLSFFVLGMKSRGHSDAESYIPWSLGIGAAILVLAFVFTASMLFGYVDKGHVGVMTTFGRVNTTEVKSEGFYVKSPVVQMHIMSVQRRSIRRTSAAEEAGQGNEIVAIAKNDVRLTMDAEFPYVLNPEYAPLILRHIGNDKRYENELIFKAAAKAVRDGISEFEDKEAYQSKRAELNDRVTELFGQAIVEQLRKIVGFRDLDEEELSSVIQILPVQITRIEPPAKILNAIEEKVAAEQDLLRQVTLTAIAQEIAQRRTNEGTGMSNFLSQLPPNVSVSDAIALLHASADMQRAQALTKAVEDGQVEVIYLSGDTSVAASRPSSPSK